MKLVELLKGAEYTADNFKPDMEIGGLCYDSRKAKAGDLFVCIRGYQSDGHRYAKDAYNSGVRVFAVEKILNLPEDSTVIYVSDTRKFLANVSAEFFHHPAERLKTIAITGTKGKTSISFMLKAILEKADIKTGVIGTMGVYYGDNALSTENSTPESYEIHRHFAKMLEAGCEAVVIEATSQGFKLSRTEGINFDVGIFTNLSPDHIGGNEHVDFEEYLNCKKMLFAQCRQGIANADSEYFEKMTAGALCPIATYGIDAAADCTARDIRFSPDDRGFYTNFLCVCGADEFRLTLKMPGKFYVYNALAAVLAAKHFGIDDKLIAEALAETQVRGRMEIIPLRSGATVIIDYAHNESSVKGLFEAVKLYKPTKTTVVFGCGGNRSKLRRYAMGEVIGNNATLSVITSDNPRYESLDDIVADILTGMRRTGGAYVVIPDRREAIEYAVRNAGKGEVVLVVGKGHQLYEEIEGKKSYFNEREIVLALNS